MTLREAFETFMEFRRGKMVYYGELEEAMRVYMETVDELMKRPKTDYDFFEFIELLVQDLRELYEEPQDDLVEAIERLVRKYREMAEE